MTRIEREGLVLYFERHWKMSLLFFTLGAAVLAAPLCLEPPQGGKIEPAPAYVLAAFVFLVAFILQFKRRGLLIDPTQGVLVVTDRLSMLTLSRTEHTLRNATVRTASLAARGELSFGSRMNFIWIEFPGGHSILFEGNITDQRRFQDAVTRLRQDLGRPPLSS